MSTESEKEEFIEQLRDDLGDLVILKASWEGRGIDDTLQLIVQLANEHGVQTGISLTVGGNIVTGLLISSQAYFDELEAVFDAASDDGRNSAAVTMKQLLSSRRPSTGSPVAYQFLHLKEAKIFNGGSNPIPGNGTLWRGKISSVDGFSFGTLK